MNRDQLIEIIETALEALDADPGLDDMPLNDIANDIADAILRARPVDSTA
ncbi:hypothetical protein [Kitasatospora sp. NPDC094011]